MSDQLNQLYVYKDKTLWGLRYVNSRVKRVGWLNVAFLGTIGFLVSEMWRNRKARPIHYDTKLLSRKKPTRTLYEDLYALKRRR